MTQMLYPDEKPMVKRRSSIDQFGNYLAVIKRGGWAPIVFDQLDGITCDHVRSHKVIISFADSVGYVFPEAECIYASDKYIHFDKEGVEQRLLPIWMGGNGEMYGVFVKDNIFISFDDGSALGSHNDKRTRIGLDYCLADETLPAAE